MFYELVVVEIVTLTSQIFISRSYCCLLIVGDISEGRLVERAQDGNNQGGSASNQKNLRSHGKATMSNEDYIKQLQAEIDRLTGDTGEARHIRGTAMNFIFWQNPTTHATEQ